MPLYEYRCKICKHVQEELHGMSETPKIKCTECKKSCEKIISTGIVGTVGHREIWEYNDIHKFKPKYLKSRDGKTRVRYDPSMHGHRKGSG